MSRRLPTRPNLEYLRKQAKELLPDLQQRNPASKLADAQHALAVEYGFVNWSSLKAHVEGLPHHNPFAGTWIMDPSRSRHPDRSLQRAALQFTVTGDTVAVTDAVVHASGREERGLNTIHADGHERASEYGYRVTAGWRGAHVLETVVTKAGQEVSRVTYEISRDGNTLTVSAIAAAHAGYPAVEQLSVFDRVADDDDAPQ